MAAPARLLSIRVQGFKSFAERTMVEFGPGISAVVGPNGSGKSNLADALRWSLGEQGRALRSRKSEDVIWAGSERRAALGMADVTLVLDNADGLLPVDFSVLELGRRLYRSGENDYLLNRQRVRLRDLVDLLDGANLADNAFLFIGQGMVDQALALRPEERRPLFEEVAGVRRHERRRRKAEDQLAESEANLARVEDILAELRPQARRLAAQAEQQATRETAGNDLANALLATAHVRWHEASARLVAAAAARTAASDEVGSAMRTLGVAEEAAAAIGAALGTRATVERQRREAHEAARRMLTALQLREARLASDETAIDRDRQRLADERAAAESDLLLQRRSLSIALPPRDVELEAAAAAAERSLDEAIRELTALQAASQAHGEQLASLRRAEAARQQEIETARRRAAEAERRARDERALARAAGERLGHVTATRDAAQDRLLAAQEAARVADAARAEAAAAVEAAVEARRSAAERSATIGATLAAAEARLAALTARIAEDEARGIARAARRRGGRRLDEDLAVEPEFRAAVEQALGDAARGYLVAADDVGALATERGVLVLPPPPATERAARRSSETEAAVIARAVALGGGLLRDAVRRDPVGAASLLLGRCVWVPDLAAAMALRPELPAGWVAVVRDGSAVVGGLTVSLGASEGRLDRAAEAARLGADAGRLRDEHESATAALAAAEQGVAEAGATLDAARRTAADAASASRAEEEAERVVARSNEQAVREAGWHEAQADRLEADAAAANAALQALEGPAALGVGAAQTPPRAGGEPDDASPDGGAVAAWEVRVEELRARRDAVAGELAARDAARREAEQRRARAEAAAGFDEERIARAERDALALADRAAGLALEREALRVELARAEEAERAAHLEVEQLEAADAADRDRQAVAEHEAATARDRLRVADERLRAADHAEVEARLGLEGVREQLLVELAGLGDLGLERLEAAAGLAPDASAAPPSGMLPAMTEANGDEPAEGESARLDAALDAVAPRWAAEPPPADGPSTGRLAALRRRYHELGAANPFAVEEYAELRVRLETLEAQQADLRTAIATTRELITDLNRMIATQFATTFRALEAAFDRQFNRLFGGGYARLSLTDPDDLAATGVEITARPPGKKAQALAMLSGGERALTAVALLFAMLEVRPVPFCVLDEVDAALDEANVGRFSEALRELSEQTQFIVITHNRGTIEAADALYGVTVGDDSVSRVISLRLDEARAIAGRSRGAEPAGIA